MPDTLLRIQGGVSIVGACAVTPLELQM